MKDWEIAPNVADHESWPRVACWSMINDGSEWMAIASPTELRIYKKDGSRWRRVDDAEQGQPL